MLNAEGETALELLAESEECFAEWTDGLAILLGQFFTHKLSSDLIDVLTELETEVSLLEVHNLRLESELFQLTDIPPLPDTLPAIL